ncbi:MAG: hypothetical protein HYU28_07215 [Actinobacteria bacterium]|nr:hypothetical protein [Actinomycetota bacterium]
MGATDTWIRSQVRRGYLIPVRHLVLRTRGAPVTQDQAWLAAVLSAERGAVLSHHSAAAAWGFRGFDPPDAIDVMVPGCAPRLRGVSGHGTRLLPESHQTRLRRIPITTGERTLVDSARGIHPWILGRVVDDGLRRKLINLPRLVRCFDEVPCSGRRPSKSMKEVLDERLPGFHPGGSAAELDVLAILRRAGIHPLPIQQYRVTVDGHNYKLDYAWPDSKHAIEFDGGGAHDTVSARHDDRQRWRRLQRAGWTIWAITERTPPNEIIAIGVTATVELSREDRSS